MLKDSNLMVNVRKEEYKLGSVEDKAMVELGELLDDVTGDDRLSPEVLEGVLKQMIRTVAVEIKEARGE